MFVCMCDRVHATCIQMLVMKSLGTNWGIKSRFKVRCTFFFNVVIKTLTDTILILNISSQSLWACLKGNLDRLKIIVFQPKQCCCRRALRPGDQGDPIRVFHRTTWQPLASTPLQTRCRISRIHNNYALNMVFFFYYLSINLILDHVTQSFWKHRSVTHSSIHPPSLPLIPAITTTVENIPKSTDTLHANM